MKKIFLSLIFTLLIQGCSFIDYRTVAVDSYSKAEKIGGSYYIELPSNYTQLQNQVFANLIKETLDSKGYLFFGSKERAKTIIKFSYEVKGPYSAENPYPIPVNTWWGSGYYGGLDDDFEMNCVEGIEFQQYYVNKLTIIASTSEKQQIWEVQGSLKTENSDIGSAFPYLLLGVKPYVGVNSNKIIYTEVTEESTKKLLEL